LLHSPQDYVGAASEKAMEIVMRAEDCIRELRHEPAEQDSM
jgi:hypothetical protein